MRHFLFLLLIIFSELIQAQNPRVIAAKIVDRDTRQPLELVSVRFLNSEIGTVTSKSGHFILSCEPEQLGSEGVLEISSMGYETRNLPLNELQRLSAKPITIPLTFTAQDLGVVVVKSTPRKQKTIGHTNFTAASMGYWEGEDALGGEIASVIRIKKEGTKLLRMSFNVLQNRSDSLRIKVNIYKYDGGDPEHLINREEIYHSVTRKKGLETISLKKYDLVANDDVLVSIQLEEAFGPSIFFSLSASAYGGLSFIRERNMPYWRAQKTVCVGFRIESSYPIEDAKQDISELE